MHVWAQEVQASIDADALRADLQAAMRLKAVAGEAASAESLLQRRVKCWAHPISTDPDNCLKFNACLTDNQGT